jgi:predicted MFS family arabinose efflux permease
MALASGLALLLIPRNAVDPERARGTVDRAQNATLRTVLKDRRMLLVCAGLTCFHLSNAAELPLLGQRLADVGHGNATRWLAICVIVAQATMVGVAIAAGWAARRHNRVWLFVLPCAVLPIRSVMAAFGWSPYWLVPIEMLDALGAGMLGVSIPILIADFTWGSGRTQTALGLVNTFQGIGASLSNALGGVLIAHLGWTSGFLALGVPSLFALAISLVLLRHSAPAHAGTVRSTPARCSSPSPSR